MTRWKWALAGAGVSVLGFAGSLGASGCSSSSNPAGSDAAVEAAPFNPATYDAAIGVGLPNCVPTHCLSAAICGDAAVNCPDPGLCGGTLSGPQQPITYCTLACSTNADCPPGAACETQVTGGHCLRTCTSDTECSGGFGCSLKEPDAGTTFCWSPFSGADMVPEAGADTGPAGEAGAPDGGGSEGGADSGGVSPDASSADASSADGGSDASAD